MSLHLSALLALGLAGLAPAPSPAAPFTATEMMKLRRLADPQVSPDGSRVAFALTEVDLDGGKRNTDLWLVPVAGGEPRRITSSPASDSRPRWSPDGTRIAFLSARDGSSQVWALDLAGGEPRKLTSLATGADGFEWIDAKRLLVLAEVFPDCGADDACNAKALAGAGKPSTARAYDDLLFRHWDTWDDGRRNHLLVVPIDGGAAIDLTPGGDDAPPFSLGGEDWSVSPDGQEACFSRKDRKDEAWSTNADVFVVPTAGGTPRRVSDAAGYDGGCRYSPDGEPPRLALAAAGRLRGRPLAAGGPRPQERREADADGVPRPARRLVRLLARLGDHLLHRRGGGPLPRLLRPLGGRSGRDRPRRRLVR